MKTRAWTPVAALGLLFAAPVTLLLQTVPDRIEIPFIPADEMGHPIAMPIGMQQVTPTLKEAAAALYFPDPALLLRHQQFEVITTTFGAGAPGELIVAHAELEGTNCTYTADPAKGLRDNAPLVLIRDRSCLALEGTLTNRVLLRIAYHGTQPIALWIRASKKTPPPEVPRLAYPTIGEPPTEGMLEGMFVNIGQGSYTRAELLSYMWWESTSTRWLWVTLAVSGVLLAWAAIHAAGSAWRTFAIALALGMTYAIVVPPLQAPDESTHLLTFARVTGQETLMDAAARWGWRLHFQRIRFHPEQRFRAANMGRPLLVSWSLVSVQDASRSGVASRVWMTLAALLPQMSVPVWLLVLRFVGACLLAVAVALVCRAAAGGAAERINPALPLLLVPTLPFFAMHVSNHAFLTSAYVLIAGAAALGVWRPERALGAGLLLASGQAIAIAAGRSGVTALPLTLAIVGGWLALNAGWRKRFAWGVAGGALLVPVLAGPSYFATLLPPRTALAWLIAGAAAVSGAGALALWATARPRPWTPAVARIAWAAAAAPLVLLLLSVALPLPRMVPAEAVDIGRYVLRALLVVATFPRLQGADYLSSDTFWGGFGWLDTYPPAALMTVLVVAAAISLSAVFVRIARYQDTNTLRWMLVLAVGFFACVAGAAAGSYVYAPPLHGRYLMPAFLTGLAVVWAPYADARRAPWVMLAVASVHGCCLAVLLLRYF